MGKAMPENDTSTIRQAETLFPSGPWRGYYVYNDHRGRGRMDLELKFTTGVVTGSGTDPVGFFTIKGVYDVESLEVNWTKTYPGSHDVLYRGFREGRGIWGTWKILPACAGGFMIWPKGMGEESQEKVYEEIQEPDPLLQAAKPGPGAQPIAPPRS
jgi:hypothetical protein